MARNRATKEEVEALRRRVWMYRSRGLTLQQIGDAVHKSKSTVAYHLRQARTNAASWYEGSGQQEISGEMLLQHKELLAEALRNQAKTKPGTAMRLQWAQEVRQALRLSSAFLFDLGLLQKTPDQLQIAVADVRSMSTDEINRAVLNLQRDLAYTPVKGISATRSGDPLDMDPETIDVEMVSEKDGDESDEHLALVAYGTDDPEDPERSEDPEGKFEEFEPYGASTATPTEMGP